ncbi:STAS domain-containing protein [Streptomyces sp. NPDC001910]|uniref:STAS domain-containing protein n=1 Tax=Streptomyces sp. NPDC001910 TaxID=3154403 RepID=UPI00331830B4
MHTMIFYRCTGRATVFLEGDIDLATVSAVRKALATCHAYDVPRIDIDLSAVPFCDASGLNVFLAASKRSVGSHGDVRLHHARPAVCRLLKVTGTGFLLANGVPAEPSSSCSPGPASGAA